MLVVYFQDNPLKYFLKFLTLCLDKAYDLSILKQNLELFKSLFKKSRRQSVITETDHEMNYLNNQIWIETTASTILSSAIEYNCPSFYDKILFVEVLCKINLESYFSVQIPNFKNLLSILKIVYECNFPINFNVSTVFNMKSEKKAIYECIDQMLENELFDSALKIAEIEELSLDLILIKQWQHKFDTENHENVIFWKNCDIDLRNRIVAPDCVIDFYLECFEKVQNKLERYILLKIAYQWANEYELANRFDLEKKCGIPISI